MTSSKKFHIHLVSDATGETLSGVARACLVQFDGIEPVQHLWWLVRTQRQVDRVIAGIEADPGIVLFTVVDTEIRSAVEKGCRRLKVPYIPVLDPVMAALGGFLGEKINAKPGRQHVLDADYFARIDAMHYTLAHDDGQNANDLNLADIILVGVSRTSKTPTCMYLANRGLKAANVPIVPDIPPPSDLLSAKKPLIVGLTREPNSLSDIRRARLKLLTGGDIGTDYVDTEKVRAEVTWARRIFAKHNWPVIDVTKKSIEEASAAIIQLYGQHLAAQETQ